jgi:hypothetical protein
MQNKSDDRAEPSVTEDQYLVGSQFDLVQDLTGGGHWLGENGYLVWDRRRQREQVALGQTEIIAKSAIAPQDAEDRALRTMLSAIAVAEIAMSASGINLANNPFANQRRISTDLNYANELVA